MCITPFAVIDKLMAKWLQQKYIYYINNSAVVIIMRVEMWISPFFAQNTTKLSSISCG